MKKKIIKNKNAKCKKSLIKEEKNKTEKLALIIIKLLILYFPQKNIMSAVTFTTVHES